MTFANQNPQADDHQDPVADDNKDNARDYGSNVRHTDDPLPKVPGQTPNPTHPQTDSNVDATEAYDEGVERAAGINEPTQPDNPDPYV